MGAKAVRRLAIAVTSVWALLVVWVSSANAQMMQAIVGGQSIPGVSYTGPLDAVPGAELCYSLRACNASNAAAHAAAVNVWRASDSALQDIHVTGAGDLDTAAAATFAGTDATATCTVSSTTFTCTGASSTPHVGDPVSGAGVSQPCTATAVGSFSGGAGTVTASNPLTGASCGTVGSGTTMTFQVELTILTMYDQTGNGHRGNSAGFATSNGTNSPQLILKCLGTSKTLPCMVLVNSKENIATAGGFGVVWPGVTGTISVVSARYSDFTAYTRIVQGASSSFGALYDTTANNALLYQGGLSLIQSATDQAFHAMQFVMNTTSSRIDVDGTAGTPGSDGGSTIGTGTMSVGDGGTHQSIIVSEAIVYTGVVFTAPNTTAMHTNQTYWGTP